MATTGFASRSATSTGSDSVTSSPVPLDALVVVLNSALPLGCCFREEHRRMLAVRMTRPRALSTLPLYANLKEKKLLSGVEADTLARLPSTSSTRSS